VSDSITKGNTETYTLFLKVEISRRCSMGIRFDVDVFPSPARNHDRAIPTFDEKVYFRFI
jgi:hypothetical protein